MARLIALALFALLLPAAAPIPPPPAASGESELRIATSPQLAPLLRAVASTLERGRTGLRILVLPVGSDVAMAELYTGKADLAVIGREASEPEIKAYQWIFQHPPRAWPVMAGSRRAPGHSPELRLLVNQSNPLPSLRLDQLRLAFRSDRTILWRELGATGAMAMRPVHPILPDTEQGTGRFVRKALFDDATLFAWDRVREVSEPLHRDGSDDRLGQLIAAMVSADPLALAIAPSAPVAGTRVIRLLAPGGMQHAMARDVFVYGDPRPKPAARAFLRLLLDERGTALISASDYRPLSPEQRETISLMLDDDR